MSKKLRHCWNCGAEIGYIDDRFYDKRDTCESRVCGAGMAGGPCIKLGASDANQQMAACVSANVPRGQ